MRTLWIDPVGDDGIRPSPIANRGVRAGVPVSVRHARKHFAGGLRHVVVGADTFAGGGENFVVAGDDVVGGKENFVAAGDDFVGAPDIFATAARVFVVALEDFVAGQRRFAGRHREIVGIPRECVDALSTFGTFPVWKIGRIRT